MYVIITLVLMKSSSESPLSPPSCLITIIILGYTVSITKNGSGEDVCCTYVPGLSDSINRCHFWLYGCKLLELCYDGRKIRLNSNKCNTIVHLMIFQFLWLGNPNASIPTPQPVRPRPMFGAFGAAVGSNSVVFISQVEPPNNNHQ